MLVFSNNSFSQDFYSKTRNTNNLYFSARLIFKQVNFGLTTFEFLKKRHLKRLDYHWEVIKISVFCLLDLMIN